jgi:hypothetical protein
MTHTPLTTTQSQLDFILVDGSSSMQTRWWESLDAIDAYVLGLQLSGVNSRLLISTFTTGRDETGSKGLSFVTQRDEDVREFTPMKDQPIGSTFGMTPLYDAIGVMGRMMRDANPPRAAITIITDGDENDSKTTAEQAKAVLDWCRAKGWSVTFIGCDFENSKLARKLGAKQPEFIGVTAARLTDAMSGLSKKRANYGLYGTPMHFTEEERTRFGGYLPSPESNGK